MTRDEVEAATKLCTVTVNNLIVGTTKYQLSTGRVHGYRSIELDVYCDDTISLESFDEKIENCIAEIKYHYPDANTWRLRTEFAELVVLFLRDPSAEEESVLDNYLNKKSVIKKREAARVLEKRERATLAKLTKKYGTEKPNA